MGKELDLIIALFAVGAGVLMLTGHSDLFFSKRTDPLRYSSYDMKKFEKPCGIVLILVGILTLADSYIGNPVFSMVYLGLTILLFAWLFWYYRNRCRKS